MDRRPNGPSTRPQPPSAPKPRRIGLAAVLLAALVVAAVAPQAAAAVSFSPKTDFTVGTHPESVTNANGVIRPIALVVPTSVNQRLPSGPGASPFA